MNQTNAVAEVAYRLGNRTDLNTRILSVMDLVQSDILEKDSFLPWFLLSEDSTIQTTSGEERIALPSDFLREYELGALWLYDSTADRKWTPLKKDFHDSLRAARGGTLEASGKPTRYDLSGGYFRLTPVPDAVYTLQMKYYQADALPSAVGATGENQWLKYAPERLITETVLKMAAHLRCKASAMVPFIKDRDEAKLTLWRDHEARTHTNMRYSMGD